MAAINLRALYIRRRTLGIDSLVDKIITEPDSPEGKLYLRAKDINESPLKRGYVESSLLTSASIDQVADILEMPVDLIVMYRDVFYNVKDFDKLSKMELLNVPDKSEASMKLWALSQGIDFIAWRMGRKINISPIDGLQDLFATTVFKAREAMFSNNVAESSKESTKWVKLSLDIARLLKMWVLDSAAAKKDIELALSEIVPDFQGIESIDELDRLTEAATTDKELEEAKSARRELESDEMDTDVSIEDILNSDKA